jgi:hypothetical protein
MRSKFPWFWIVQFFALALLSFANLFYPYGVLEYYRGHRTPQKIEQPTEALNSWVLGLEEVPVPSELIREFFSDHHEVAHEDKKIWTPHDPALKEYAHTIYSPNGRTSETINHAWEEVQTWILSIQPAPPPEDVEEITNWIRAVDEIQEPSAELRRWISTMDRPQPPPKELRLLILSADQILPASWQLASDHVRLTAPCIMAAALFTLLGLLTPSIRRPLARAFVLMCLFWTVGRLRSSLGPPEWNLTHGTLIGGLCLGGAMLVSVLKPVPRMTAGWTLFLIITAWWTALSVVAFTARLDTEHSLARIDVATACSIVALMGIVNAYYWLIGKSEDPPQDDAGIAQRRPPQLWTIWFLQFSILLTNGLIALIFPDWLAELFTSARYDYLTIDIVNDSVEMLGAWTITMAMFSYFALGVGRDWIWQGIAIIFSVIFTLLAISTVQYASSGEYSFWLYLYGFQGVVFVPMTIALLLQKDPWTSENVERATTGDWCLTDLLVAPPLLWRPLLLGHRTIFRQGIAARGYLRVLPETDDQSTESVRRPENDFFVPGRQFKIEMRFSTRTLDDEAGLDIRGCGLKMTSASNSQLELLFATGAFAPFATLNDFCKLLHSRNLKKLIGQQKIIREGLAAGMRRAPSSFAILSYYHQFVIEWLTPAAEEYLVRFRLVPSPKDQQNEHPDLGSLCGDPDDDDLRQLWIQDRRSDETRGRDYLRNELCHRIRSEITVSFQLEMQFHRPRLGDSLDWYDPSREWDSRVCPWIPLAELVLEETMSDAETERLYFDPSILPSSFNVPRPDHFTDMEDPRTIAAARHRIAGLLGRVRARRHQPRVDNSATSSISIKTDGIPMGSSQ